MDAASAGGHPAFDAAYEHFWRDYRSPADEHQELDTIVRLGCPAPGTRVLDLACGFGRIALGLAERGMAVRGVDSSPSLLALARERTPPGLRVEFVDGDMRQPQGDQDVDLVLVWSTSLGYYEEADDLATLRTAWAALRPGGCLLVETRHWDTFGRTFDDHTERASGADRLREWHRYDPVTGRQHTVQELQVAGTLTRREYHLRRYGVPELRSLALSVGFTEVDAFDEAGEPLRTDSRRAVLRAVR